MRDFGGKERERERASEKERGRATEISGEEETAGAGNVVAH